MAQEHDTYHKKENAKNVSKFSFGKITFPSFFPLSSKIKVLFLIVRLDVCKITVKKMVTDFWPVTIQRPNIMQT